MLNMKSKMKSILQGRGVKPRIGPTVGIELEFEGAVPGLTAKRMRDWTLVEDHSLREGGIEFVSRVLPTKAVPRALELAHAVIKENGLYTNKRCGVHVHVNCTDLSVNQLWSFIVLYTLLEPHIFRQFAAGREENHFCVPVMYNTHFVNSVMSSANQLLKGIQIPKPRKPRKIVMDNGEGDVVTQFINDTFGMPKMAVDLDIYRTSKYCALNLSSLKKFGTLEFRHMGGTDDIELIQSWVDFLVRLRKEAKGYKSPDELVKDYETNGLEWFLDYFKLPRAELSAEQEYDIVDSAYMMCGVPPTDWKTLEW